MPTTGVIDGTKVKMFVGGTPVAVSCQTEVSFEISHETRDTTCKDATQYATYAPGMVSVSASCSGLLRYDAPVGASTNTLEDSIFNRTELDIEIGSGISGDPKWAGKGYVENLSRSGSLAGDNGEYEFSIKFSGAVTRTTYP